jgi:hypothetical protein
MPKKAISKKKLCTKKKIILVGKTEKTTPSPHIPYEAINTLIGKIISEVNIEDKVRWAWGIMSEYRVMTSSSLVSKHIAKCKECQDFLNARKSLAELVIRAARV